MILLQLLLLLLLLLLLSLLLTLTIIIISIRTSPCNLLRSSPHDPRLSGVVPSDPSWSLSQVLSKRPLECFSDDTTTTCGGEVWHGVTSGLSRETCTKQRHRRWGATWCYIVRFVGDILKQRCNTSPPQGVRPGKHANNYLQSGMHTSGYRSEQAGGHRQKMRTEACRKVSLWKRRPHLLSRPSAAGRAGLSSGPVLVTDYV